jgi:hypothetical protein
MISLFASGGLERINLTWASLEMALLSRGAASITSTSKLTGMRAVVGLRANRILIFPVARSRAASASSALFAAMALTARSHVTVVPLADMRIARLVFSRLGRTSKKRQSLRREIFAHIARNAILQHPVLSCLENIRRYSGKCSWSWQEIFNFETSCYGLRATDRLTAIFRSAQDLKPLFCDSLNQHPDAGDIFYHSLLCS